MQMAAFGIATLLLWDEVSQLHRIGRGWACNIGILHGLLFLFRTCMMHSH